VSRRSAILAEMGLAPIWRLRSRAENPENQAPAPVPRSDAWVELKQAVSGCVRCGLSKTRTQTVFGVGDENADWMLIGEAPGAEEDRLGDPFVGQAGKLLDNMLAAIDLERGAEKGHPFVDPAEIPERGAARNERVGEDGGVHLQIVLHSCTSTSNYTPGGMDLCVKPVTRGPGAPDPRPMVCRPPRNGTFGSSSRIPHGGGWRRDKEVRHAPEVPR
jgi:hypothetical protein